MDARTLDLVSSLALSPAAATTTAAATSGSGLWQDTRAFDGDIAVTQVVGAVSGTSPTLNGKLQVADDANGTGAVDVTGATFAQVTAAGNVQTIAVQKNALAKRYLGYVGTIAGTTPSFLVGAVVHGRKQTV